MRIVFLDKGTLDLDGDVDLSALDALGELIVHPVTRSEQEVIERSQETDCLITNKVKITSGAIRNLPSLQHIAVIATGYNNVDLAAASAAGVAVSNVPGYAGASVPQHVFALLLNLVTSAHRYHRDIMRGEWQSASMFTLLKYPTWELTGKTMGIIGFGTIGQGVARIAEGFGMQVMMHRASGKAAGGYESSPLTAIYEQADVISLNCPLTEENRYMINADVLRKMKSSAILINTARGPLVNQHDLAEALNAGVIAGAGIDVLDEEPPQDNPLLGDVKNVLLTPHSAWSTIESRQRLADEVVENIKAALAGVPRNLVSH